MSSQQPDPNANATSQTPPSNQQTNIDWSAVNNLLVTLSNAAKASSSQIPEKTKFTDRVNIWVSILTLALTFLTQIVFAYYQIQKNEQFQIQFDAMQRNAVKAKLEIPEYSHKTFTIRNTGPSTANNVKITIGIIYIHKMWRKYINNIKDFKIGISDNSLVASATYLNTNIPNAQAISGENADKITLYTLPTGEDLTISFDLLDSLPTKSYTLSGNNNTLNIFFQPPNQQISQTNHYNDLGAAFFDRYFNEILGVAAFDVTASCDNCESSNSSSGFVVPYSPDDIGFYSNIKQEIKGFTQEIYELVGDYVIPKDASPLEITFPISFQVQQIMTSNPYSPQSYVTLNNATESSTISFKTGIAWPDLLYFQCIDYLCTTILQHH